MHRRGRFEIVTIQESFTKLCILFVAFLRRQWQSKLCSKLLTFPLDQLSLFIMNIRCSCCSITLEFPWNRDSFHQLVVDETNNFETCLIFCVPQLTCVLLIGFRFGKLPPVFKWMFARLQYKGFAISFVVAFKMLRKVPSFVLTADTTLLVLMRVDDRVFESKGIVSG